MADDPVGLSDDDVFGAAPSPPQGLSDDEVFGAPAKDAPSGFLGSVKDVVKSIPSDVMRGLSESAALFGPAAESEFDPEGKVSQAPTAEQIQHMNEKAIYGSDFYKPQTEAGKIVGSGIAAASNPTSYIAPGGPLTKAGIAMLSGMGSEVGGEVAGTPGAIIGGIGAAGLPSAAKGLLSVGKAIVQPMTEGGQQTIAGQVLARRASDVDAVRSALDNPPAALVPGSDPTTFQLTGDMGLGALERETAAKNPQDFMQRRTEQNAARVQQISSLQAGGDPMDVSDAVRGRLTDIDQMTQSAVDSRLSEAQAQAEALGGQQNQEAYGASLRSILQDAETEARTNERSLWNAVDPDNDLTVNMTPVQNVARDFYGNLSQAAQSTLKPVENQILGVVGQYGAIEPFRELTDLRSLVSQSMREELSTNGRSPAYGRLSQLRGGIEDSIRNAVGNRTIADAVNVAAGRLAPENTIAANIQRQIDEWQAGRNATAQAGTVSTTGSPSVPAAPGRAIAPPSGPPNAAGDQGLQGQPITSNFDEAAAQRLRAATDATRERAQTFGAQPLKSVLQRPATNAPYNLREAAVPAKIFHPGDTGFEDVNRYRAAVGDDAALPVLQDYAANSLREAALTPEGTIDPAKFARWQAQHAEALRAFPELAGRFSDAAAASSAVGDVMRLRQEALQQAQQGPLRAILNANNPQDIAANVGAILGGKNAVRDMGTLVAQLRGNPDAMEGLRKAIADHITRNFISNTEAGTSGVALMKSDDFQTFMKKNGAVLEQVFSPEQMSSMRSVAADLQRANRSVTAVKLPGGSNTPQDVAGMLKNQNSTSLLGRLVSEGAATVGGFLSHGLPGAIALEVPTRIVNALRSVGYTKVDDLVKRAMLDPAFAKVLLSRVPPKYGDAWQSAMARRIMQVSAANVAAVQGQPTQQQKAGGGSVKRAKGGPVDDDAPEHQHVSDWRNNRVLGTGPNDPVGVATKHSARETSRASGGKVNRHSFHPSDIGGRLATDGHWYVKDPKRPGKYLMVVRRKSA
jgi:hypothetical protein